MNKLISPETRRVLTLGREKYWGFRVSEGTGVLAEETYKDGWWYLPTDSMQITRASKRIEVIKSSGVRVRQVIIAHEAPKLLCGPQKPDQINKGKIAIWVATGLLAAVGVVTAAAMITMVIMYLLVPLVIGMAVVMMMGLGLLIDPVAIIVLEDGTRIEVLRWVE